MSMSDPIADMLARIKNAQAVNKRTVSMPASKLKVAISNVLKAEGYIADFRMDEHGAKRELTIDLKYAEGRGVIDRLERYSLPSRRRYFASGDLPRVQNGLGVAIVSTSHGVMSDSQARSQGHGGEVLCLIA